MLLTRQVWDPMMKSGRFAWGYGRGGLRPRDRSGLGGGLGRGEGWYPWYPVYTQGVNCMCRRYLFFQITRGAKRRKTGDRDPASEVMRHNK